MPDEALLRLGLEGELVGEDLDRHRAVERVVAAEVDVGQVLADRIEIPVPLQGLGLYDVPAIMREQLQLVPAGTAVDLDGVSEIDP